MRSEIEGSEPLSPGTLGYFCALTRDAYFDYVHEKLAEAEVAGVKRADIAARIRKSPSRLSKILAAPGNWTLDTITELLVAIAKERVVAASAPILAAKITNSFPEAILTDCLEEQSNLYKIVRMPIEAAPAPSNIAQTFYAEA